jgi:hypothetical protein
MTNSLSVNQYIKYANVQMAAESFIRSKESGDLQPSGQPLVDALINGNGHNSRFTKPQAENFATHWIALDQRANTPTGFSGTLFRCIQDDPATGAKTGELVLSFRSTEFIDDAARDNQATNAMELAQFGFAFGQIRDMQAWYAELNQAGGPLVGQTFSVTGYSLGGHLASAFNLMYGGDPRVREVVTFNGAGVGGWDFANTNLAQIMSGFTDLSLNANGRRQTTRTPRLVQHARPVRKRSFQPTTTRFHRVSGVAVL